MPSTESSMEIYAFVKAIKLIIHVCTEREGDPLSLPPLFSCSRRAANIVSMVERRDRKSHCPSGSIPSAPQ